MRIAPVATAKYTQSTPGTQTEQEVTPLWKLQKITISRYRNMNSYTR
jgi:hypothetical protein